MRYVLSLCATIALFTLCGCAAGISRQGYTLHDVRQAAPVADCHPTIKCNASYDPADVEVLGQIKAYDTSISTTCDEAYVLDIFCKDGCARGADLVNIVEEHYPSFWSTCYQAKAQFVRFKNRDQAQALVSDAKYEPQLIIQRSVASKKRQENVIVASVMGGLLGGIIVSAAH